MKKIEEIKEIKELSEAKKEYFNYLKELIETQKDVKLSETELYNLEVFVLVNTEAATKEILEVISEEKNVPAEELSYLSEKADILLGIIQGEKKEIKCVSINGNNFTFKEGFNVEKYYDRLFDIGNNEQGETWDVFEDKGDLVIW